MRNDRKKPRKRKTVRIFSDILLVCLIAVFIFSGYNFLKEYRQYQFGDEVYSKVNAAISVPDTSSALVEAGDELSGSPETGEDVTDIESIPVDYPDLSIDFAELKSENPDFVGVLYIPALDLYYPMTHSHDNDEYLNTLFTGESSVYGCIFLEKDAREDFRSLNSFIYGHNMKNGTMFGSLKRFERNEGLCATNPYIYIYTENRVYKYHIFSYYQCPKDDPLYQGVADEAGYDSYVADCQRKSEYHKDGDSYVDDFSKRPPLITLSTCVNVGETTHFLVVAAMVGSSGLGD